MMSFRRALIHTVFAAGLLGAGLGLHTLPAAAQEHVINLKDADIRAFIEDTSVVTGKTFIVDPRVTGTVSVSSQAKLTKSEVFQVFLDVLRVRGFIAIPTNSGAYRITLVQGAAQETMMTSGNGGSGLMSTAIIKLDENNADDAAKLIKPVLHSQGRLTANPGGRVIVVTDYPENIRKARAIIAAMDESRTDMQTVPLTNISAAEARDAVASLMGNQAANARGGGQAAGGVIAVAVEANNSLILRGEPEDVLQMAQLVRSLDTGSNLARGQVSVVSLRYANGEDLVGVLESLLPAFTSTVQGKTPPSVAHEPSSNSLIISADAQTQAALESVVRRLDVRRAQVLVEAIIVEISDNIAEDLGLQFVLSGNDTSGLPLISTNYSRSAPNLLAVTGALAGDQIGSAADGLQDAAVNSLLGMTGGTFGIAGSGDDGLFGVILNAVQNDTDSNVLSTPFVTTMDNVPATFLVGQEVPFTSGEGLGDNNSNPFRTINREEVGIKLEVLPQINEGDVVRLEIKQEVSSIAPDASTLATDIVTNKREIETTVLADDGEIIVLGGLIQDDEQLFTSQVPILGDIPVVGNLFKSNNNSRRRTNLMVFIRPTIIRSRSDAAPVTQRKLDVIRQFENRQIGDETSRLDEAISRLGGG